MLAFYDVFTYILEFSEWNSAVNHGKTQSILEGKKRKENN